MKKKLKESRRRWNADREIFIEWTSEGKLNQVGETASNRYRAMCMSVHS